MSRLDIGTFFVKKKNHGTLLREPDNDVVRLIQDALMVDNIDDYNAWLTNAGKLLPDYPPVQWQQFVVRAVDERGDPINDYNIELMASDDDDSELKRFDMEVHIYGGDRSLRCFHVNLTELKPDRLEFLKLHIIASSGTDWVKYHGVDSEHLSDEGTIKENGVWDAKFDLTPWIDTRKTSQNDQPRFQLFYPFTTTFIEIRLNREPMPLVGMPKVFQIR
jgi:hypothetical protein